MIKIIFFDVDNTLYPKDSGLFDAVDKRINKYLEKYLKIPKCRVNSLRKEYFLEYGTTLNGLMYRFNIEPIDYLEYVHNVHVENYICQNFKLKTFLKKSDKNHVIFSNAYEPYILRILKCLGISDCFSEIYDIVKFEYKPKPLKEPYKKVIAEYNILPEEALIIDDSAKNLETGRDLGMKTLLLNDYNDKRFDLNLKKIEEIREKYIDF